MENHMALMPLIGGRHYKESTYFFPREILTLLASWIDQYGDEYPAGPQV